MHYFTPPPALKKTSLGENLADSHAYNLEIRESRIRLYSEVNKYIFFKFSIENCGFGVRNCKTPFMRGLKRRRTNQKNFIIICQKLVDSIGKLKTPFFRKMAHIWKKSSFFRPKISRKIVYKKLSNYWRCGCVFSILWGEHRCRPEQRPDEFIRPFYANALVTTYKKSSL